ncbi:MAG: patatin-like phospholipase family protein [Sciscionella sp.]|nr:patatin-like phospholipase family protein [Sciscionella sp.]
MNTAPERGEHPVLTVIRERLAAGSLPGQRSDPYRVALAIEGGGNRGIISGGMAQALYEHGLLTAFDAMYGSSSGALTAVWLLAEDLPTALTAWTDAKFMARFATPTNLLRRRPLVDLEWLTTKYYDRTLSLDTARVLASPITMHPLATDTATGRPVDLHPFIVDKATLYLAMRASAALPVVAGRPVELNGSRYLDAGLVETVPLDTPLTSGVTHMLVLSSRREGDVSHDSPMVQRVTGAWLRRAAPATRQPFLQRGAYAAAVAERLAKHNIDYDTLPAVFTIRPAPDSRAIGRMTANADELRAGLAAGRAAMLGALSTASFIS